MRFNEISEEQIDELQPGQVPGRLNARRYFGAGKVAAQSDKQDKQIAKNLYKMWYGYAVKIDRALQNDPEKSSKTVDYFKKFLTKALKVPATDPVFSEIDSMLGNGTNYNDKTVMQAITRAVQQRALSALNGAVPPPARGNTIPTNTQVSLGIAGNYIWTGTQWVNSANNQPAPANLITRLNQQAAQLSGSPTP